VRPSKWLSCGAGLLSLQLSACQTSPSVTPSASALAASDSTLAGASATAVGGGCGDTQVFEGPGPDAAVGLEGNAWAPVSPASAGMVAYFFYAPPNLVSASPSTRTKVLWIFHGPAQSGALTIDAHPLGTATPTVHIDVGGVLAPGGNYPSGIDLPAPGCWRLELTIGSAHATMDLQVAPAS
jgi:hypothetical protein